MQERWLHGSFDDIIALQERCFPDAPIVTDRTSEPWVKRKAAEAVPSLF